MTETDWTTAKDALVRAITDLGFPAELGEAAARHLGSPKAIGRLTQYVVYTQPHKAELIVDEMLAIRSEIDAWRDRKDSGQASVRYNEMLYYGRSFEEEDV